MPSTSPLRTKFFIFVAVLCISSAVSAQRYSQTNLVSDISGLAAHTDSRLVNPWGISFGPTSPFWIADNGTGLSTLYEPDGSPAPFLQNGVVIPPPAGGSGSAPTGTVFDSTGQFVVSANGLSGGAIFLFATEDRSEEHTSELQSQSNLVCRLLLEKKKKRCKSHDTTQTQNDRAIKCPCEY